MAQHEDAERNTPWRKIRWVEAMALDARLTAADVRVGVAIGWHWQRGAVECWPSQQTLTNLVDVDIRTVRRAVLILSKLGYIHVTKDPHRRKSDRYAMPPGLWDKSGDSGPDKNAPSGPDTDAPSDRTFSPPRPDKNASETGHRCPTKLLRIETMKERKVVHRPPEAQPTLFKNHFERFWEVFPRHYGKKVAEKEFHLACKRADPEAIIAGAKRFADANPRTRKEPSWWLKEDGWDDKPNPNIKTQGARPDRMGGSYEALETFINGEADE